MSIDMQPLLDGIEQLVEQIFQYVPLGLLIFGPVAAIVIGFAFGGKIVDMLKKAFGGGGR